MRKKNPIEVIEKVGQYEGAPLPLSSASLLGKSIWYQRVFNAHAFSHLWDYFHYNYVLSWQSAIRKKVGLVSSLLLATSMLQVLYSRETRLYAMYTLLSLLATYLFIKIYRNENNNKLN